METAPPDAAAEVSPAAPDVASVKERSGAPAWTAADALQVLQAELSELRMRCATLEDKLGAKEGEVLKLRQQLQAFQAEPAAASAPAPAAEPTEPPAKLPAEPPAEPPAESPAEPPAAPPVS